jgi:hypothetical protein
LLTGRPAEELDWLKELRLRAAVDQPGLHLTMGNRDNVSYAFKKL